jgi:tetratricopeptide (TPR) repeat protein
MKKIAQLLRGFLFLGLILLAASGCSREGKRDRYLQSARNYLQKDELVKAEIEFLNAARLQQKDDPEVFKQLGLIYYIQGQTIKAFAYLSRVQQLAPDDVEARSKLALLLLGDRRLKEARQHAEQILTIQPLHADALWILVETALTPEEIKNTHQRLEQLKPKAENASVFWVALGRLAQRQRDFAAAETSIRRALELDPKSTDAHTFLGSLHFLRSNSVMAEQEFRTAADLSPPRGLPRLQYADFKLQSGDPEASKGILQDLARKVPDWMPVSVRLAQIALAQTNYKEAESLVNKVLAQDPYHVESCLLAARVDLAQGHNQRGLERLRRMLPAYDHSPLVHYHIAHAQLANRDVTKAVASLNQALTIAPNYGEAVILLAETLMRRGDIAEAVMVLSPFAKQNPDHVQAHTLLATAYLAQNNPAAALTLYNQLADRLPKNPRIQWLTGMAFLRQTNNAAARGAFDRALELSPGSPEALQQLTDLDIAEGRHADAIARLEKQLKLEGGAQSADLLMFLAKVQSSQKDIKQAEATLLKAIEIRPVLSAPHMELASLYVASGRFKEAIGRLENFIAKTNDIPALMRVAAIYERMTNFTSARDSYEKVLATDPAYGPALNNLAFLYSERLGQPDKAHKLAQSAREALPHDPSVADTLGWILYKQGEYARASTLIQESASKLPNNPEVQFHLGMTHYALGEEAPARVALQRAIQPATDSPFKAEASRRLALLEINPQAAGSEILADLEKRHTQEPRDLVILSRLAAIYERQGSVDKLLNACQTALKHDPRSAQFLIRLARAYAGPLKNLPKALELAKNARNLAPEDPVIAQLLGHLNVQSGDYKWGSSLLQDAARKISPDPELLFDLAWAQYNLGQVAEAQSTMQNAVQLNVSFSRAEQAKRFLTFVDAYKNTSDLPLPESEKILESEPDYIPALMIRAASLQRRDDYLEAGRIYDRILARSPLFLPAIRQLAILHGNRVGRANRPDEPVDPKAYELAVKAREALPEDAEVAKALGLLVFQRGDYRRSSQLLKQSSLKRSDDPDLLYHLGMAHYRLKENNASKEALQRALVLNVQPPFAVEARRVIAELSRN